MNSVVRRKKKTLFGRIIRKVESELTPKEEKLISPDVPIDEIRINDDMVAIQSRREELKLVKHDNSDEVITL